MNSRVPVAKGGMFGAADRPSYSRGTQDLLKVMMEESKLTNFQRRTLRDSLKGGQSLPVKVAPTSSDRKAKEVIQAKLPKQRLHGSVRTKDMIEQTGAYERDRYVPKPVRSLEKEKQRLSNMMAYGEDIDRTAKENIKKRKAEPEAPRKDRFDEIEEEIRERKEFLESMEKLGQGKPHRVVINTQISQLIREMEIIDKQRTAVLEQALENEEF